MSNNGKAMDLSRSTGLPPWLAMMRAAAQEAVTQEDIEAIVKAQVEKAKDGDDKAMKFVFEQVLGGASLKGATFHQHIHNHGPATEPRQPDPTGELPGSNGKIEAMARRVANGQSAFADGDAERSLD